MTLAQILYRKVQRLIGLNSPGVVDIFLDERNNLPATRKALVFEPFLNSSQQPPPI